jgi:Zn-dependent peptidase ImmA (M78 family)
MPYGTSKRIAAKFGVSAGAVRRRVKASGLKPVKGKTCFGQIRDFYSVAKIQDLCADLIAKKSKK